MPPLTIYCYVVAVMFTIRSLSADTWGVMLFILALGTAIFGHWTDQRK